MKTLVILIVKYLKSQLANNTLSSDAAEGVEVAVQCLENAYGVSPEDVEECTAALEDLLASATQSPEAGRAVSDEQKEEAESLKLLGNKLMKDCNYAEAITYYTRAMELDPRNPVFYCNRAAAHIQTQNYLASINDCHEAIRLDPTYSKAHSRLGYAYQAVGNRAKAREHYGKALELEPDNESYKSCFQKLAEQGASGSRPVSDLMGMLPGMDLSAIMKNPSFMQMASQMLEDPGMQNAVSRILSGQSSFPAQQVEELINAGQQLADRLQNQPDNQQAVDESTSEDQLSIDSDYYPPSTHAPNNTPRIPFPFGLMGDPNQDGLIHPPRYPFTFSSSENESHQDSMPSGSESTYTARSTPHSTPATTPRTTISTPRTTVSSPRSDEHETSEKESGEGEDSQ